MTDPHPDSTPDHDQDRRSDIERAVYGDEDHGEDVEGGDTSPLEPTVSPDGAGGAGGTVKNQDETAQ